MDIQFLADNAHWQDHEKFTELDPDLCKLKTFKYLYKSTLLQQFPGDKAGIVTLTGGCFTGKTILLKQCIAELLAKGIEAQTIVFFSGKLVNDYHQLISLLQKQLSNKSSENMHYVFIDDVTVINHWDKAIAYAANAGWLDHTILILTSSDRAITKKIPTQLANLESETTHFHLYPLTFHQFITMKFPNVLVTDINLFEEFNDYLLHGGYLIAINDMAIHGYILDSTLKMYMERLQKEILTHGRQENFLREILTAIVEHYNSQTTWNLLSQELSIDHPKTIGDYIALLESFDAVFVQSALLEETLKAAPKKARKLMFCDPFIFHAVRAWLYPNKNSFKAQIKPLFDNFDNIELCSKLAKACVTTHYRRFYPTYYIKAEGEVDLAYVLNRHFWPVVVTWTNQLRAKDLKQLLKYPNSKILTKTQRSGLIEHIRTEPLPQALWKLAR